MSKQKLTPWFPADVMPVRPGVYETEFDDCADSFTWHGYSRWDGFRWWNQFNTVAHAANGGAWKYEGAVQEKRWRGLAAPGAQEGA